MFLFFFFKQKTAYEMRISDWSSDVCSSDLMVAYVFLLFGTMIAAFLLVAPLSAKLGKRDGAILAGAISLLVNSGIYFAWIQGFFPGLPGKPSVAWMFGLVFVSNTFSIILLILSSSMMAAVVEA